MLSSADSIPQLGTGWFSPPSVEDACEVLGELQGAGRPIAGCTMLTPLALSTDPSVRVAVDLTTLPELQGIEQESGRLRIGATATAQALATSTTVRESAPMLASVAGGIGDEVLRGMATIGGNVAARAPAPLELPIALAALGASIKIASSRGARSIHAIELSGPGFQLARDEVIETITVPTRAEGDRWSYRKLTTNLTAYSIGCVALRVPATGEPAAFAGLGTPIPQRLDAVERALANGSADPARVAADACASLVSDTDPLASASYRLRGLEVLLEEELLRLTGLDG